MEGRATLDVFPLILRAPPLRRSLHPPLRPGAQGTDPINRRGGGKGWQMLEQRKDKPGTRFP